MARLHDRDHNGRDHHDHGGGHVHARASFGKAFAVVMGLNAAFVPTAQLLAEEKEPWAVIELGAATERSIQDGTYSAGPSASVEFPVIKDWLEIETGISPLFRPGQSEWQADLLFKKPFTINEHVEFMIGAGPQLSYATAGGGTKIASEIALEWMIWPTKDRKFGWFVEPTYSYSLSRGHEQAVGVAAGLTIAIP